MSHLSELDDLECLPQWPDWMHIDSSKAMPLWDYGWWTIKNNLVVFVSPNFEVSIRELCRLGERFDGWKILRGNKAAPYVSTEEMDRFRMENLL